MRPIIKLTTAQTQKLNSIRVGLAPLATKRYYSEDDNFHKRSEENFIRYTKVSDDTDLVRRMKLATTGKAIKKGSQFAEMPLLNPQVLMGKPGDVEIEENDAYKKILVASNKESNLPLIIKYGGRGVMPSPEVTPSQLLTRSFELPRGETGILAVRNYVPFSFDKKEESELEEISTLILDELEVVNEYDREEIEKKSSVRKVFDLPSYMTRTINAKMQEEIFASRDHESFFEETTLPLVRPNALNQSSQTAMFFDDREGLGNHATASHYHPGDRVLYVFTTNIESGVKLNFCGINENPDDCPHTAVKHVFPPNSLVILTFPEGTHHSFSGEFSCISGHPKDGRNIIENIGKGSLGFLESATVFSPKQGNVDIWDAQLPANRSSKSVEKESGNIR